MPLTRFGKELRKLRIDRDLLLKTMADALNVSASFLSAVETGRKSIPAEWPNRISHWLQLDLYEAKSLETAAALSVNEFRIPIDGNAPNLNRSVAATLSRTFGKLDDDKLRAIQKIISGDN